MKSIQSLRNPRHLLHALILLLVPAVGRADDWPLPQIREIFSESRDYYVRTIPGESWGDTFGFSGRPKGKYATAEFHRRNPDGTYVLTAQATLVNPIAPVEAFISNEGRLATLDNWHNVGHGKVIAIYDSNGRLVRAYELAELFPPEEIKAFRHSVSSLYWKHPSTYIKQDGKTLSIALLDGRELLFDLETGRHQFGSPEK